MFSNISNHIKSINVIAWIVAYVVTIMLYTQIPTSADAIRDALSIVAKIMLAVIVIAALYRLRDDL